MVKTRDGTGSVKEKKKANLPSPTISKRSPRIPSQPLDAQLRPRRNVVELNTHTRSRSRQLGRRIPMPPLPPRRAPPSSSRSRSPQQKPQTPQTQSQRRKPPLVPVRRMSSRRSKGKDSVSSSSEEVTDVVDSGGGGNSESSPEVAATTSTSQKSTEAQSKTANGVTSTATPTSGGSTPRCKNANDKDKLKVNGVMLSFKSLAQSKLPILRLERCQQPTRPVTRSISKSPSPQRRGPGGGGGHGQGNSQSTSVTHAASASRKSPVRAEPLPSPEPPLRKPPSKASSQSSETFYSAREDSASPPQQTPPPPVQQAAALPTSTSAPKALAPENVPKSPPSMPPPIPKTRPAPPQPQVVPSSTNSAATGSNPTRLEGFKKFPVLTSVKHMPPLVQPPPNTSPAPPQPQVVPSSSPSTNSAATASNTTRLEGFKKFPVLTSVKYMPLLVHPPPKIPRPTPSTSKSAYIPQVSLQRQRGKPEPFMWHLCLLWSRKILELLELNSDNVCKRLLLTKLNIGKMMSEVVTLKYDWPYMDWREDFFMFEITEKKMTVDRALNFGTLRVTEATHALNESVPLDDRKWILKFEPSTKAVVDEMVRLLPTPTLVLIWGAKVSGNREIQLRGAGGGQGAPRILIFRGEVPTPERMKMIQNIGKLGSSELRHLDGPKVYYKRMAHRNFQDDSLAVQLSRRTAAEIERVIAEEKYEMSNNGFPRGCRKVTLVATILPPEEDIFEILGIRPGQNRVQEGQSQSYRGNLQPQLPRPPPPEVEDTQAEVEAEAVAMEEDDPEILAEAELEVVPETRESSQGRGERSTSVVSSEVDLETLRKESADVEKKKMPKVMANGFQEAADDQTEEPPVAAGGSQAEKSKVNHDHDYVSCSQREMMLSQEMELTDDEDQVDGETRKITGNQSQGQQGQAENETDSEDYHFTPLLNEL